MHAYNKRQGRPKPRLQEKSIDVKELLEVDAKDYNNMKMQGLSGVDVQKKLKPEPETDYLNFNVSFAPPKKERFAKTGVFLPKKNQRYANLKQGASFAQPQQVPQRYSYTPKTTYASYARPEPQYSQPVVVSRVVHRTDGQTVSMPANRYMQ